MAGAFRRFSPGKWVDYPQDRDEPTGPSSVCNFVFKILKNEFRTVWRAIPGDRFHSRYRRTRRRKGNGEMGPRVFRITVAIICASLGIAFLFVPMVLSSPFFLASGALLASESGSLAHGLDRFELKLRSWTEAVRKRWRMLSPAWKGVVASLLVGVVIAKLCFIYYVYRYCRG